MQTWLARLWMIAHFVLSASVVSLWIVAPEYLTLNISLSVFTLCLSTIVFFPKRTDFVTWLKSQQFKTLMTHVVQVILVAGSAALINHLSYKFPWREDFSRYQMSSLSEQSQQILKMVNAPMRLTLFATRGEWNRQLVLLNIFRTQNHLIEVEAVDMETQPSRTREAGVTESGTLVMSYQERTVKVTLNDELSVTNGLLKLLRDRRMKVYFTSGHGEASCSVSDGEGLSQFCRRLNDQLYDVLPLDLARLKSVPMDADIVFIVAPDSSFLPQELERLSTYLEQGGSLFVALTPSFEQDRHGALRQMLNRWGIILGNDLVIDRLSTIDGQEATVPIISHFEEHHPVTKGFNARAVFPLASSVSVGKAIYEDIYTTEIAQTSDFPGSWGESDLKSLSQGVANFNDGKDLKGPVSVVAVSERRTERKGIKDTRVAAFGSAFALFNAQAGQQGNQLLALNLTNWLAFDESLISLNRPQLDNEPVILSNTHVHFIFYISIVLIPLVFFIVAFMQYQRRKRL